LNSPSVFSNGLIFISTVIKQLRGVFIMMRCYQCIW
jgi:hypothetical protein